MEWVYLVIAGFFKVSWAIGLKYSQGNTITEREVIMEKYVTISF